LELAKVCLINYEGEIVYENFVHPKGQIADYNTKYSGITKYDLKWKSVKTLEQIRNDLLNIITADSILIGHALENDLRVLKISHKNIIDTSVLFPHKNGFPYKRGLKAITREILGNNIQDSVNGHSCYEDSLACLDLVKYIVDKYTF
jgi:RNA exonuclease 1